MITQDDVARIFRLTVPSYAKLIDETVEDLGEAAPYILTSYVYHRIVDQLRSHPENSRDIRAFLEACEEILAKGDEGVKDLVVLQVVEAVAQPNVRDLNLEKCLGPLCRKELNRYRRYNQT